MKPIGLFVIPCLALLAASGGCGKKEVDKEDDRPRDKFVSGREKGGGTAATREPLKAVSLDGVITGRVVLQGDKPVMEEIATIKSHNDKAYCLAGQDFEKREQTWIIGPDNGVANVVISLKPPAGKYFVLKDDDKKRTDKVIVDQPHCAFIPHVSATYPSYWDGKEQQPSGEELVIKNDAPFNHNTNWAGNPSKNPRGNVNLTSGKELPLKLVPDSTPVQLSCDIHPWMRARVWVFDHPYFAVTKEDGRFEIKNVPTGVELGLVAWHEAKDFFNGGKEGKKQKFNPGENKVGDLTISAK
jgi:hypothetical protein